MHLKLFRYLLSLILINSLVGFTLAQETRFNFNWTNRAEARLPGEIVIRIVPQPDKVNFFINLSVTWFGADGTVISGENQMPFLYLSSYNVDISPVKGLTCLSVNRDSKFDLKFQSAGSLILHALPGCTGDFTVSFDFQYALSSEDYEQARLWQIQTQPGRRIRFTLNVTGPVTPVEDQVLPDKEQKVVNDRVRPSETALQLQRFEIRWAGLMNRKDSENLARKTESLESEPRSQAGIQHATGLLGIASLFMSDLDGYMTDLEQYRSNLDQLALAPDTLILYRNRIAGILNGASTIRNVYNQFRIRLSTWSSPEGSILQERQRDSLQQGILTRYKPELTGLNDTLSDVNRKLHAVFQRLNSVASSRKAVKTHAAEADSLVREQQDLQTIGERVISSHQSLWIAYRRDVSGLELIPGIEQLHSEFNGFERTFKQTNDSISPIIARLNESKSTVTRLQSNWLVRAGLILVTVLIIILIFRNAARNKEMRAADALHWDQASTNGQVPKGASSGIFTDGVPEAFYSIDFIEILPESVIGKMHFSAAGIKAVYQLIHGAFLEKKAGDFGGYFLGSQYKLPGSGKLKHEMIIEKACPSSILRAVMPNSLEVRDDLMEEMNEIIRQNKKLTLIGWFTASHDNTLEMNESLAKVHRILFKEKWQFGVLINPGSEDLQSAVFMHRKSGYFEPYPDPASFIKWEEMYRFAIQPPVAGPSGDNGIQRKDAEYAKLELDQGWTDSIIRSVSFLKTILNEISQASGLVAIPTESFQPVGYLYGAFKQGSDAEAKSGYFNLFVDRFIELTNEPSPRDLPGYTLLGWWGQGKTEIFSYLPEAIAYHEQNFGEPYQICCLVNALTGELRVFTRKTDLGMNNNVIETQEFNLSRLV